MGNSVSAASVCRRFIHFRRRGANRGPVTPLQGCKKVHPPPLLEFEGQLPPPASIVRPTSREAHSVSGTGSVGPVHPFGTRSAERSRAQNAQESRALQSAERSRAQNDQGRRTLKRTRTQSQNRILIFARVHRPVTSIPQQSLGYDTRETGEQTTRSPTSLAICQCREFLPKVHPFQ